MADDVCTYLLGTVLNYLVVRNLLCSWVGRGVRCRFLKGVILTLVGNIPSEISDNYGGN
jgi:hypothetical protein